MLEVSETVDGKTRKYEALILRALAELSQAKVAERLGVSDTKISRDKDSIGAVVALIAACDLKVVPAKYRCVDPERAKAMITLYEAAMERVPNTVELLFGDED